MAHDVASVLAEVTRIAPSLHLAGTFSAATLAALVGHASERPVHHSAETGSGASTLLFSHLSEDHTVFAVDAGTGSIRSVEGSPLLRGQVVTFVEGPTQITLPRHTFADRLQLALIDGPHGYPFPDLEYYFLYPHLDTDALLIVDDIHIPTITNLFDFLCADEMFELREVVETTAFFRRTAAPLFSPVGDGWWTQGYNKKSHDSDTVELMDDVDAPADTGRITPFYIDQLGPVGDPLEASKVEVHHDEDTAVAGWAIDTARRRPAAAVDLVLDGARYRAPVRLPRADVAATHGNRAYLHSGFNARLPAAAMTRGPHELELRVVLSSGAQYCFAVRLHFEAV